MPAETDAAMLDRLTETVERQKKTYPLHFGHSIQTVEIKFADYNRLIALARRGLEVDEYTPPTCVVCGKELGTLFCDDHRDADI